MNVIVANKRNDVLSNLDVDVIKNVVGEYSADELVAMFKDFYCDRIILDITALNNYEDIKNIEKLVVGLGESKLILFLTDEVCTSNTYLSGLISMGVFNFTNNYNAIKQLINKPNTYKDVASIQESVEASNTAGKLNDTGIKVIGVRNVTDHAGATSLCYMIKKGLVEIYGPAIEIIEVNKNDLSIYNDKNIVSVPADDLDRKLREDVNMRFIVVDLNDFENEDFCDEVLYLIEPSAMMLNRLVRKDIKIFEKLANKKIILNKSTLNNRDVSEFENEANTHVFFNIPPLDDRKKNSIVTDLLFKLGINNETAARHEEGSKIFGLFKF